MCKPAAAASSKAAPCIREALTFTRRWVVEGFGVLANSMDAFV